MMDDVVPDRDVTRSCATKKSWRRFFGLAELAQIGTNAG